MVELTIEQQVRFFSYVQRDVGEHGCWMWKGYHGGARKRPCFRANGHNFSPRRIAWELQDKGELGPKVYLFPTVCEHVWCIRPEHMTWQVGGGNMRRKKCRRGHELTEDNVYITTQGKRACRRCIQRTGQARRERYLLEDKGWGRSYKRVA